MRFILFGGKERALFRHPNGRPQNAAPLLLQGNTASHEFVNTEFNYMAAASEDKEIFMSEGSCHDFAPVDPKYGDTLTATCRYFADWIGKPGRFME